VRTTNNRRIVSVILAAGKGTRMHSPNLHKVCFPLDGKPVIARSIEGYERCGVDTHCVVVGAMAEQVMQAASLAPVNLLFCHQVEQLGTGNATRCASKLLNALDFDGDIMVVAGDKVIEDAALNRLIGTFRDSDCDLAFMVGDVADYPDSGRIVCDNGRIIGNVEVFDIARMQLLIALQHVTEERVVPAGEAESLAITYFKNENKASKALGALWDSIQIGEPVTSKLLASHTTPSDFQLRINNRDYPPELLAGVKHANISVYLFKARALYSALEKLGSDNAQNEEYLTDVIGILAGEGRRVSLVPVDYPEQVMAYNTPQELRSIEDYLESRKRVSVVQPPRMCRTAAECLAHFETPGNAAENYLISVYGEDYAIIESKRRLLSSMLKEYISEFGDQEVYISRSPGRVNILGRHIDHQGGHVNMTAIDRDFYSIFGVREDRRVVLHNMESHQLPDRTLDIDEICAPYTGGDWLDFVNGSEVKAHIAANVGDWSLYVTAPIVRLQAKFPDIALKGMNIVASGNIPMAAGLSSSSAVVVAVAEGVVAINGIDISAGDFVTMCGEAEWYVGTRGGSGDHAAMKFAKRGRVVQLGFFPFHQTDDVPFTTEYLFIICNSHEKARKSQGARDVFNHRVACYNIGREIYRQRLPEYADRIEHLRDISCENLAMTYPELLQTLNELPCSLTRADIRNCLPEDVAEKYLMSHSEDVDSYPIRSVVMYGLAECARAKASGELLRRCDIRTFGEWVNHSHDGDRVVRWDRGGNSWPAILDYTDSEMSRLISSAEPGGEITQLPLIPGSYTCSIPQIDKMVDIANSVHGVCGAQILGAGLGGCIMVLVHEDSYDDLVKAMSRQYYDPLELEPEMFACRPVAGSGMVEF